MNFCEKERAGEKLNEIVVRKDRARLFLNVGAKY